MYKLAPNKNTCSSDQAPDLRLFANNYKNSTEEEEAT
jgi:hypothetical protein